MHNRSKIALMLLMVTIMQISGRNLPETDATDILAAPLARHARASLQFGDVAESIGVDAGGHHRRKREPYDPYGVYYYYPSYIPERPAYYRPVYINRRDTDDNRLTEKGQKYKYTPLFQYKSTQSKRRKLFVPNLFG